MAILLARDNLPGLVSNLASNVINKFERKLSGKGAVRAGKGFTLFIFNKGVNDIIKIIKQLDIIKIITSLEDSGVLMDGVTETIQHERKKQEGAFPPALLALLAASLLQPEGISGKGVRRAGRGYMDNDFSYRSIFEAISRLLSISITNLG